MGCTTHTQVSPAPSLILDLGCGTGVVSTQLGRDYPTAQVYGIDLSPVPKLHEKPPNVEYIKGDIHRLDTLDPRIPLGSVDLTFGRLLVCGITDWPACIATMTRMLKPGGFVELQDLNNRLFDSEGRRVDQDYEWMRVIRDSLAARGLDPDPGINTQKRMEFAGLVDVRKWEYKWTVGPWLADREPKTKRFGEFEGREMVKPLAMLLDELPVQGEYSVDRIERLKAEMRNDMQWRSEGEEGIYFTFTVTVGRKP